MNTNVSEPIGSKAAQPAAATEERTFVAPTVTNHVPIEGSEDVNVEITQLTQLRGVEVPLSAAIAAGLTKTRRMFLRMPKGHVIPKVGTTFPGMRVCYREKVGGSRPAVVLDPVTGDISRLGYNSQGQQISTSLVLVAAGTPDQRLSDSQWLTLEQARSKGYPTELPASVQASLGETD